ncbi:DUF4382 domain-containing protein [Seongchinamella sediminis]|nr:DUF4382 domain-containing protein [Seongchinamella sediminis]
MSIGVTDAAVDNADRILVQFTGVGVNPGTGAAIDFPLDGDSQTCQDLLDGIPPSATAAGEPTVRCVELLELQGTDSVSLLQGVELQAGEYTALRLQVDAERGEMDSIIVLDDGTQESLFIPSGSQSGLKLNSSFTILAGGTHNFVVDFDLRKSVNDPQGFPDYRLRPSLRLVDLAESGNITGSVQADLLTAEGCTGDVNTGGGFAVYAYVGGLGTEVGEEGSDLAPLTSAAVVFDDASGQWRYTIGYLPPGEYTVGFTCQAADDSPEVPDDGIDISLSSDNPVSVVADQDSEANFP